MNVKVSVPTWVGRRFPDKKSAYKLFIAVVFPVHIWAIIVTLQMVPTYLLHLKVPEIIGIIAYTLAFILLECIGITLLFMLIGAVLPQKLFKLHVVAQAALLVPLAFCIAYLIQVLDLISFLSGQVYLENILWFEIWIVGLILLGIVSYFISKFQMLSELLMKYVDRITILSLVYIIIDLLAVLIIIWRNFFISS